MDHKDFISGKSVWIWRLAQCLNGDIDAIIKKCKDYDLSSVLIKNGDGANLWTQLTREIVKKFQDNDIKVYAWAYNYGLDPVGEANVAIHNLDLGVNGFIFDAEVEFRDVPDPTHSAETMLQAVRARYPDAFLAYTPLAIIDYHTKFPYVIFGKYCDAAMPQVYYGLWTSKAQSPVEGMRWMRDNWNRWHENWKANGAADSVKPIIPIAQAYDEYKIQPPYILKPSDIYAFTEEAREYKAVSFYSFQHILRDDCWEAIRDAQLSAPTTVTAVEEEPAAVVAGEEPVVAPAPERVEEPVAPVVEPPAPPVRTSNTYLEYINGVAVTITEPEVAPAEPAQAVVEESSVAPGEKPQKVQVTPELPANIAIPTNEKTTVTFKPSKDGSAMQMVVHPSKTHLEYFLEFIGFVASLLKVKK